jgi:uncharacterized protein YodC (DUF2158 family)
MAKFKKGDVVKVKATVPEGPVDGFRMDEEGNVLYLFSWTDGEGNNQTRWFDEAELELA